MNSRCPITYEIIEEGRYSARGLRLLSPRLKALSDFPFTANEQLEMALKYSSKLSIQGVQPKLSAKLNIMKETFELIERGGTFILKPPHHIYEELPQNEDLTMRLAAMIGIEVPLHGMIYATDGSLTYFIKRFDRIARGHKLAVEDFSQLLGYSRETKYDASMEKLAAVIDKHCTFPMLEKIKFFRLLIFNFLVGNEDMHLKNFSIIRRENKVELSPAYDLINSSIVINGTEEMALPLRGKKSNLKRQDLVEYFALERLGLGEKIAVEVLKECEHAVDQWIQLIHNSFLSSKFKQKYLTLLNNRVKRLLPS
jgi:serine/threonine-protein kinase HipA